MAEQQVFGMTRQSCSGLFQLFAVCFVSIWVFACQGTVTSTDDGTEIESPPKVEFPGLILQAEWLKDKLPEMVEDVVLLDVRTKEQYAQSHLPGAVNLPTNMTFNQELGDFQIARVKEIEALFGSVGITRDHAVLIYDDGEYRDAARMFWILELHGHVDLAVLDGGWAAWQDIGGLTSNEVTETLAAEYQSSVSLDKLVNKLKVRNAIAQDKIAIIDARPKEEYMGEKSIPGRRIGRIPSAVGLVWTDNLILTDNGSRMKDKATLKGQYEPLLGSSERAIVYCNKGKQSAVSFLALRTIGKAVSAYDGSWFEWGEDHTMPVELGE